MNLFLASKSFAALLSMQPKASKPSSSAHRHVVHHILAAAEDEEAAFLSCAIVSCGRLRAASLHKLEACAEVQTHHQSAAVPST